MHYTPEEVAKLLANRPNQPHYIASLIAECVADLQRWKSTHAPRLDALEGLLRTAQQEAHAGREAIATLASERAANALLTERVQMLELAEGVAAESFGRVVQQHRDAEAECKRLRQMLEGANASILRMSKLRGE